MSRIKAEPLYTKPMCRWASRRFSKCRAARRRLVKTIDIGINGLETIGVSRSNRR